MLRLVQHLELIRLRLERHRPDGKDSKMIMSCKALNPRLASCDCKQGRLGGWRIFVPTGIKPESFT